MPSAEARWCELADYGQGQDHRWTFLSSRGDFDRWRETTMVVTAYTAGPESTGKTPADPEYGITASGKRVRPGTAAADPSIPFGTRLWVEGYGLAVVEDRGEAIRGNRLDLYFSDVREARAWGVRKVRVVFLD